MLRRYENVLLILIWAITSVNPEKLNFDVINNYSEFLNHGEKKSGLFKKGLYENEIFKSKVDILGEIFKKNVESLKRTSELDIIFLIDASSSVGEDNFRSELKFVKKLLSDVTIDLNHTRVGIITFSSSENVLKNVDEISVPRNQNNKCLLLNKQLTGVNYTGGETFTLGAFQIAQEIFENSRNESKKVLFLITDGFSNGGDPVPIAEELKKKGTTIFTIGIRNGNFKELYRLSSDPGEIHSYLLDSFEEFESLARRALHVDLKVGDYIPLGINSPCDSLCKEGDCCDKNALCTCGTSTGHYSCICPTGYYGSGLKEEGCSLCPVGFYSDGPNLCTPCPDAFHITKPPAYGKDSCKCKTGFREEQNNTHKCEAITCQKLSEPKHGYFVKKSCDVVINSACGARCEVGYNLSGTSIRLCQNNGSWTGIAPSCHVRTCEKLTPPAFGSMTCSHSDLGVTYNENQTNLPVDTVCSFKCDKGKIFIGSKHRTCLPVAKWNGLKAMCRQVKCSKIPPIANAKIEPRSCTYGKQSYGKKCSIKCNEGFETHGPKERSCTGNLGSWNTKEETYCKDVAPPIINCPKNITGTSKFALNYAYAIWEAPVIIDNSDDQLTVWTKPPIANLSSFQFLIGKTNITYFAEDSSKNRGKCITVVTILDTERPIIENCINPPPVLSEDGQGANVTWDEPNIYDNSHHATVTRSHSFGYFKMGVTTITYTAVDDSGNKNLCQMNITVKDAKCDDFVAPDNGRSECSKKNRTTTCIASCNLGFSIPLSSPLWNDTNATDGIKFVCNATENFWYNEEGLTLPECSVNEQPKEMIQNATTEIEHDFDCVNDIDKVNDIENDLKSLLTNEVCIDNCSVITNAQCIDDIQNQLEEEKSNIIRRDVSHNKNTQRTKGTKRRKKLRINIQIAGPYTNDSGILTQITHKNSSIYFGKVQFLCSAGYIPRNKRCVQCPRGTYQVGEKCKSCSFGFFNAGFGKTSCTPCPVHFSTRKYRSKSITECKKQCSPGTHARKKVLKNSRRLYKKIVERATLQPFCKSCPIGYYQDGYGQLECNPCPKGYTTHGYGSTDVGQCVETAEEICLKSRNICNNGLCEARDRIHYDCNCFEGYIGSHCEKRIDLCRSNPCQNGGSCLVTYDTNNQPQYKCLCFDNFFGSYCEQEVNRCSLKCNNGGKCIEYDDQQFMCLCREGYEGELCQPILPYCDPTLCENNSTCLEEPTTYHCKCSKGYIGKRCHLLPCDFRPCPTNAICKNIEEDDATINSYRCVCPEGWTGKACDIKIDFCSPNPCQNNGTCISLLSNFECSCPKPFYGNSCEKKYDSNYVLVFERFRTSDYVRLPPFQQDLKEITVCMWLKVTDTFNYGTLISYATRENDNTFTLTDYTGLIMYVNGQYIATDVFLNDGIWHHVCATWRSAGGVYQVYIDGKLRQFGSGLSTNRNIAAYGYMIIGQEQDALGGKFSQSETFVGKMTSIDIWSKALNKEEILRHFHDCQNPVYGDLYAWTDFQFHLQGQLKREESQFCNECPKPKKIINGFVEVKNKSAYYKCQDGYNIGNNYRNGRKCLKSSKWEGQREPYCRRLYCGPPGFLKNGFVRGSNYYFEDQVTFGCIDGYNLVGTSVLTCVKTGRWEPSKPKCLGPQCIAFKIPLHGNITVFAEMVYEEYKEEKTVFDVGTQIEVNCIEGFNLIGESVITCQESGIWDNEAPICESPSTTTQKPPRCSVDQLPLPPENGHVVEESLEAFKNESTDIIEYNCNIGYKVEGLNTSACIDGYWQEINITCNRISCGPPGQLRNGLILGNSYMFNDEVNFQCETGYSLNGTQSLTCGEDGSWEGTPPMCIRIKCELPQAILNGKMEGENNFYGDTIAFQCNDGFKLEGSSTLICKQEGSWSSHTPRCAKVSCGPPGDLSDGFSFGRSYKYEDYVTFDCNDGYKLSGDKTIRCEADGLWKPRKPKCIKISCGHPGLLENGQILGEGFNFKDVVSFECEGGYTIKGNKSMVCGKDGEWISSKPECVRILCGFPENFENGIVRGNAYHFREVVNFECKNGYKLEGNKTAKCEEDGKWSSIPECRKIFCGSPGVLENGLVYGNSYYFEDEVVFACNEGYNLVGTTSSLCAEDGQWKSKIPTCEAIPTTTTSTTTWTTTTSTTTTSPTTTSSVTCRNPKIPLNMIRNEDDSNSHYLPGNSISFDCVQGYKMLGNNIMRCSKSGRWSRLQGKCRRISCRQPEVSKDTKIIGGSYLYGDSVTIVCKNTAKYELKCSEEGAWEGPRDSSC